MEYKGYYHCRLCKKEYYSCGTGDLGMVMKCMAQVTNSILAPNPPIIQCPEIIDVHFCADGSRGVADFIGFKKDE